MYVYVLDTFFVSYFTAQLEPNILKTIINIAIVYRFFLELPKLDFLSSFLGWIHSDGALDAGRRGLASRGPNGRPVHGSRLRLYKYIIIFSFTPYL